jgi:hypothetical protein
VVPHSVQNIEITAAKNTPALQRIFLGHSNAKLKFCVIQLETGRMHKNMYVPGLK